MLITENPRRQHRRRDDAERAVQIFYPAGFCYWVCPLVIQAGDERFKSWVVKVSDDDGQFLGYAYDRQEECGE